MFGKMTSLFLQFSDNSLQEKKSLSLSCLRASDSEQPSLELLQAGVGPCKDDGRHFLGLREDLTADKKTASYLRSGFKLSYATMIFCSTH